MFKEIYQPMLGQFNEKDIWAWYTNAASELRLDSMLTKEAAHFRDYYVEAGLLRWWRRPYFRFHFCRTFAKSTSFLLENAGKGVILDLGCGCGTQSLYLALKGASVVAVDLDETALSAFSQRKKFYEQLTGRKLDIAIHCADVFKFDYSSIAPIAGLHSMFAFNMMQPSSNLIDQILPHMSPKAHMAILDINTRSWMARLLPWRKRNGWSPIEFRRALEQHDFHVLIHEGGVVLPPIIWRGLPNHCLEKLDRILANNWLLPISQLIIAVRNI